MEGEIRGGGATSIQEVKLERAGFAMEERDVGLVIVEMRGRMFEEKEGVKVDIYRERNRKERRKKRVMTPNTHTREREFLYFILLILGGKRGEIV